VHFRIFGLDGLGFAVENLDGKSTRSSEVFEVPERSSPS
jgi:hypothetical protein